MINDHEMQLAELKRKRSVYLNLPYDARRVAANLDALALAEQLNIPSYRLTVRYDLIWAYVDGDDPAKALPLCAEFFTLFEEYPNCRPFEEQRRDAIDVAMVAFYVACSLPQISLEQCRDLLEQSHEQVKRYRMGERFWHSHVGWFCLLTGDLAGIAEHLQKFKETPRDELSDCEACEATNMAELLLGLSRRKEAWDVLKPVLDGTPTCSHQPWSSLSLLIHDALDHGELDHAKELGKRLARYTIKSSNDLSLIGALLRLYACTDLGHAVGLLEKGIQFSIKIWDQNLLFDFYRGAWAVCSRFAEQIDKVFLVLPDSFPLYQEDGNYDCKVLAQWFYDEAEAIGQRFDRRNGSDYYGRKLAHTLGIESAGERGTSVVG